MKVNTVGRKFSEVERAYTAGFLDADGAIMACIEKHQEKRFGFRIRVTLKISQSNRTILDWFCSKTHSGYIRKNRTIFDWDVKDQRKVQELLNILAPYLHVKKEQARLALKILSIKIKSKEDLIYVAQLADTLSKLNVRSKNRRKNFSTMI